MAETFRIEDGVFWAGSRAYRWAQIAVEEWAPNFRRRQATISAESGWTLSVIWGDATYSDNYMALDEDDPDTFTETPERAEIGILDREGNVFRVYGHCTPSLVNELFAFLTTVPTRYEDWSEDQRGGFEAIVGPFPAE